MSGFDPASATAIDDAPKTFDASSATPVDEPEETTGRVAGLAARAGAKGVANLVGMGYQGASALSNIASPGSMPPAATGKYEPQLSDFVHPEKWQQAAEYFADKASNAAGLPTPANAAERIGSKAVEAAPSAVLNPEAPIASAASSMLGGASSQVAAEKGAGPVGQFVAGMAGGSLPVAGALAAQGTRALVRGGAQGQADMEQRLKDAAASGDTQLSLGQASGNSGVQYLEGTASKLPGSAPLKKLPGQQAESLGSNVSSIVDNLSGGARPSPTTAGAGVETGIAAAKKNMRAAEMVADAKQDALIPNGTQADISGVLKTLDKHAAPIPGAEPITAVVSPKISEIRDQIYAAAAQNAPPSIMGTAPPRLPYDAVAALKTRVGTMIDWGFNPSNPMENGQLKDLYGALSNAKTTTAQGVSPAAAKAANEFNALYKQNEATRDSLNDVINKNGGPENIYQAATNGTKLGATKVGTVMSAINPDQQNLVRATVLDKLGRASGAQDAPFSASTFLTNWTKLDPSAKDALFGASGNPGNLRSGLDSLTSTMGNIRAGTKLNNWSGTTEAAGHVAGGVAAFEGLKALAMGDPHTALAVGAGFTANNLLSRALVNPKVVNWFAQTTKMPTSQFPNALNQLNELGKTDPDARDLAAYLNAPPSTERPQRASGGKVDIESLVTRLMNRWKAAKRETDATTKPLLNQPDAAIIKALDIAQAHI
jgi:hypothetical protein